ncbi:MAG TPA: cytochrome c biogenesis protein CcdA [Alphaproteobacteria bacterium]
MTGNPSVDWVLLPIGLGLFGFVEPCSLGSTLVFIKVMEGYAPAARIAQVSLFALTRAVVIGLLGVIAAGVGSAFLGFQRTAWVVLGVLYLVIGVVYLIGRAGWLMHTIGPSLARLSSRRGSVALGALFGLNIPACAAPLLLALLGAAAAGATAGRALGAGFVSLGLFGLALSLPLLIAVLFAPAQRMLDSLVRLSGRLPVWTGLLLTGLGAWSIWFGLFVSIDLSR